MLLLRSIFFTLLMPGTITVLIPFWLVSAQGTPSAGLWHYAGLPLIVIGAALLLWCIGLFYAIGRDTLAPIDPPKHPQLNCGKVSNPSQEEFFYEPS